MGFEQLKVEYIDHMGTDLSVVNAARVSFDKESEWEYEYNTDYPDEGSTWRVSSKDRRLINYLARHGHWTPFAHTAITLRVTAPIFVRTQLFKHKVGLVENEISRRYVDSDPEFYLPDMWRGRPKNKKQGSGEDILDGLRTCFEVTPGDEWYYTEFTNFVGNFYETLLESDICPEQARMVLPQSMMTQWFWTGNVASFARVYGLRYAEDAQAETGEVARKIGEIVERLYPVSWEALTEDD